MSHEEAIVRSFIRPERRPRWMELLGFARGREKLRRQLCHCENDLDPRFVHRIVEGQQANEQVLAALRLRGAGSTCYVFSENDDLDQKTLDLDKAVECVLGFGLATFLSIHLGRLAYFEGEEPGARFICERNQLS